MERARRLRMGLAHPSPGASGDTARPNYVGPSGNGLVKRMKAGESPPNQGRSVCRPPLSVFRRRSRGLRKNAAVERREVNALRHWACAARRSNVTPRLSALRSLTFGEGRYFPHRIVRENHDGAPRALKNRGGGALAFFSPVV